MAEYILSSWESPDLVGLVPDVAALLEALPHPPHRGSFTTEFNEWSVAKELSLLPHDARYSCAFQGEGLPQDVFATPLLGEARAKAVSFEVTLNRDVSPPRHGYRGEQESRAFVHVTQYIAGEGWARREHDPDIIDIVTRCADEIAFDHPFAGVHLSGSSPGANPHAALSYILRYVPLTVAADVFRELCGRFVPSPTESYWEHIGRYVDVDQARASVPPGTSPACASGIGIGGNPAFEPWFALERCTWTRPVANFEASCFLDLATGIATLRDRLVRPAFSFGPLIWPSREPATLPICHNHVIVRHHRGGWRVIVGIWKENDDDPDVREVRKYVENLVNAIRPTSFKKGT